MIASTASASSEPAGRTGPGSGSSANHQRTALARSGCALTRAPQPAANRLGRPPEPAGDAAMPHSAGGHGQRRADDPRDAAPASGQPRRHQHMRRRAARTDQAAQPDPPHSVALADRRPRSKAPGRRAPATVRAAETAGGGCASTCPAVVATTSITNHAVAHAARDPASRLQSQQGSTRVGTPTTPPSSTRPGGCTARPATARASCIPDRRFAAIVPGRELPTHVRSCRKSNFRQQTASPRGEAVGVHSAGGRRPPSRVGHATVTPRSRGTCMLAGD
jgi:hypothetical protein